LLTDKSRLQLPEPMGCSQPGTFSYDSVHVRLPGIIDRIIAEGHYPLHIQTNLKQLQTELCAGTVRPITPGAYPDGNDWDNFLAPHLDKRWHELPWFFAETYFYRRLLEAVEYFKHSPQERIDPFLLQKRVAWTSSEPSLAAFAERSHELVRSPHALPEMLLMSLWSNRADLSIWPAEAGFAPVFRYQEQKTLLIDHAASVMAHLDTLKGEARVDIVLDNAGLELAADLCLSWFLLESGLAHNIRLHAKKHPTFVSDTTIPDIQQALSSLTRHADNPLRTIGKALTESEGEGFVIMHDAYWNSPLEGWNMPEQLRRELASSSLILLKGDANYRRLVGDRAWSFTTPFEAVCAYFPAPLACLRTLKSEVLTGLQPGIEPGLRERDPGAFTSGRYGILQASL